MPEKTSKKGAATAAAGTAAAAGALTAAKKIDSKAGNHVVAATTYSGQKRYDQAFAHRTHGKALQDNAKRLRKGGKVAAGIAAAGAAKHIVDSVRGHKKKAGYGLNYIGANVLGGVASGALGGVPGVGVAAPAVGGYISDKVSTHKYKSQEAKDAGRYARYSGNLAAASGVAALGASALLKRQASLPSIQLAGNLSRGLGFASGIMGFGSLVNAVRATKKHWND